MRRPERASCEDDAELEEPLLTAAARELGALAGRAFLTQALELAFDPDEGAHDEESDSDVSGEEGRRHRALRFPTAVQAFDSDSEGSESE